MKLSTRDVMMWAGVAVAVLIVFAVLTGRRSDDNMQQRVDDRMGYHVPAQNCHVVRSDEFSDLYRCDGGTLVLVDSQTDEIIDAG